MAVIKTTTLPYPSREKITTTFAVGCTLRVWTGTVQVMSDIWESAIFAEYWDEDTATVKTDCWFDTGTAVDATAEVVAKAEAWLYDVKYEFAFQRLKSEEEQAESTGLEEVEGVVVAVG